MKALRISALRSPQLVQRSWQLMVSNVIATAGARIQFTARMATVYSSELVDFPLFTSAQAPSTR